MMSLWHNPEYLSKMPGRNLYSIKSLQSGQGSAAWGGLQLAYTQGCSCQMQQRSMGKHRGRVIRQTAILSPVTLMQLRSSPAQDCSEILCGE